MMTETAFLLFTLVLDFGEATTCKADSCPGLTISGGFGTETNIETFPDKVNCTIPPFPTPGRRYHSLSVMMSGDLVACGGFYTRKSCISWSIGQAGWIEFANLSQERSYHATVVTQNDTLIIFGGDRSSRTGEIVKSEIQFVLEHGGDRTCAISYEGELVLIGGFGVNAVHGKVDRYDSQGKYLGSLNDIQVPRSHHACASFVSTHGEEALLVTGGSNQNGYELSTELYLPSNKRWTRGPNLPRGLFGLRAAHLNRHVVLIGGSDGSKYRDEVLEYDGETWEGIGRIKIPRGYGHAIIGANLGAICPATATGDLKGQLDPRIPENAKLEHSGEGSTLLIAVFGLATSNGVLLLLLIGALFLLYKMKNSQGMQSRRG